MNLGPSFQSPTGQDTGILEVNGSLIRSSTHSGITNAVGAVATINKSTIRNNPWGVRNIGGNSSLEGGFVTINNSNISDNGLSNIYAMSGLVDNAQGSLTIINNSTISNSDGRGGNAHGDGIHMKGMVGGITPPGGNGGAHVIVNNSTIVGNNTGIDFQPPISGEQPAILQIKNSIVADNNDDDCASNPFFPDGTGNNLSTDAIILASGNNFDTDGSCSGQSAAITQVTVEQLNLGPLQDNGGTTNTHALIVPSVAIDAATDCTFIGGDPVLVDQRFLSRNSGSACDSGSFEAQGLPSVSGNLTFLGMPPATSNAQNTIDFAGAAPGQRIIITWGFFFQSDQLRNGPCAGASSDIKRPRIFRTRPADSAGNLSQPVFIPASFAGLTVILQGVTEDTCESSNAETVTFQ